MPQYHLKRQVLLQFHGGGEDYVWEYQHCKKEYGNAYIRAVPKAQKLLYTELKALTTDDEDGSTGLEVVLKSAMTGEEVGSYTFPSSTEICIYDVHRNYRMEALASNKVNNQTKIVFMKDTEVLGGLRRIWNPRWMSDRNLKHVIKKRKIKAKTSKVALFVSRFCEFGVGSD